MVTVLVTGSRTWDDSTLIAHVLKQWLRQRYPSRPAELPMLRHGGAEGADTLAADLWRSWHLPLDLMRPRWKECGDLCSGDGGCRRTRPDRGGDYCSNAGFQRNHDMVDKQPYPEIVFAFIRADSHGATDCADYAEERGLPVRRYIA
jgi:hypothetical protein